jgi:hypothetical protein
LVYMLVYCYKFKFVGICGTFESSQFASLGIQKSSWTRQGGHYLKGN